MDSGKYMIDDDMIDELGQVAEDISDDYRNRIIAEEEAKSEQAQAEQQAVDTQADPRNSDTWGAKALIKEGQSILSGGLQDTASSLATFPERTIDALSGAMQRERQMTGEYRPDWTPFNGYDNPIETKTWWGGMIRGLTHFGTLAAVPLPGGALVKGLTGSSKAARAAGLVLSLIHI